LFSLGSLAAVIVFTRMGILYNTNLERFYWEAPFLVSSITAIFAGIAAILATQALGLTRSTTRPFLALQPGEASAESKGHVVTQEVSIMNTGSLPANILTAELTFFGEDEEITEDNVSKQYPKQSEPPRNVVVFPNYAYHLVHSFDLSREIERRLFENMRKGKVKWRVRITYRGQEIEYMTVQTERIEKEEAGKLMRIPIPPQLYT